MKVLIITYALPYPPLTGSALIALHHIKHLAAHHTVDLVSFKSRKNPGQLADLPRWCNSIELVDRPPRWRVLMNIVMGIVRDPHPVVSRARSEEMSKVVDRRLAERGGTMSRFFKCRWGSSDLAGIRARRCGILRNHKR